MTATGPFFAWLPNAAVAALCLFSAAPAAASGYRYVSIAVPGAIQTSFSSLSSNGSVGGYFVDSRQKRHGFVFIGGALTTVDVPGALATSVTAINAGGTAVGYDRDVKGVTHGFTWSAGVFTTLDLPGATLTEPLLINDSGTIAGTYIDRTGANPGFVIKGGVQSDIRAGSGDFPTAINGRGTIIGHDDDAHGNQQGFATRNGTLRTIRVAHSNLVELSGINGTDRVVGYYHDTTAPSPNLFGFVQTGAVRTSVIHPGASETQPAGINGAGLIVGYYLPSGQSTLLSFTTTDGATFAPIGPAGAAECDAEAINDAGQIAGNFSTGIDAQVFLATPD